MTRPVTPSDEGKRVVTPDGDVVGTVVRVDARSVLVRPREELLRGCGSWIAGPWEGFETFELDSDNVVRVSDNEVVPLPRVVEVPGLEAPS